MDRDHRVNHGGITPRPAGAEGLDVLGIGALSAGRQQPHATSRGASAGAKGLFPLTHAHAPYLPSLAESLATISSTRSCSTDWAPLRCRQAGAGGRRSLHSPGCFFYINQVRSADCVLPYPICPRSPYSVFKVADRGILLVEELPYCWGAWKHDLPVKTHR